EGQTEQTFVRDILAQEMACNGMYLYPVVIGTPGHKGGDIRFSRAKKDIGNLLKQRDNIFVSTMFDYFRIDTDWPGKSEVSQKIQNGETLTATEKAEILENATHDDKIVQIFSKYDARKRFIPYIEMHEFEALLFSDTDILAEKTGISRGELVSITELYNNPEEINDDPAKAPSKRLESLLDGYRKVAMGKIIAEAIGIQTVRQQCPHFNQWIIKLESLKKSVTLNR
ncbi:MAG: DUF4276 family protein, partial [Candidatus Electrothrix sp. AR3]|nr:DUF4276 family protein [Candidatus Electrothrix sp. AR3]